MQYAILPDLLVDTTYTATVCILVPTERPIVGGDSAKLLCLTGVTDVRAKPSFAFTCVVRVVGRLNHIHIFHGLTIEYIHTSIALVVILYSDFTMSTAEVIVDNNCHPDAAEAVRDVAKATADAKMSKIVSYVTDWFIKFTQ